jgi:hypothetical protein
MRLFVESNPVRFVAVECKQHKQESLQVHHRPQSMLRDKWAVQVWQFVPNPMVNVPDRLVLAVGHVDPMLEMTC